MIKSSVTIALVPHIKTGPWIYWDPLEISVSKAAALGFDGVELFTPSAGSIDPVKLKNILDNLNIKLSAVGTGAGKVINGLTLTDPNPEIRKQAISFIRDMISFGAAFGAPAIIGSMQGKTDTGADRDKAVSWLVEGLNILGQYAENEGVNLVFEPLNRYETNLVNCMEDGVSILNSLKTQNVKLLADLFHMNIEERSVPESIRKYGPFIGHVHFADSNRNPIGNGHIEMKEIADALIETGYRGFVSAEVFPWPDPDKAAEQTIGSFRKYFR